MRLLDRYLLRELLLPLGFCLCGFLVIWSSIELITELPELQKAKLRGWDVPEFCLMQVPLSREREVKAAGGIITADERKAEGLAD